MFFYLNLNKRVQSGILNKRLDFWDFIYLGEANFICYCTSSRENYFGSVGWQKNNNNSKFQGQHMQK